MRLPRFERIAGAEVRKPSLDEPVCARLCYITSTNARECRADTGSLYYVKIRFISPQGDLESFGIRVDDLFPAGDCTGHHEIVAPNAGFHEFRLHSKGIHDLIVTGFAYDIAWESLRSWG